jgi:hypothetical protein
MRRMRGKRIALLGAILALLVTGSAWAAFQGLPADNSQVNNDATAGIDPTQSVSGGDPTNADVVGGALTAGKPAVPWAIFQQQENAASDQVFVRSFANGVWTTRGAGTVGGASDASTSFPGSLNFDRGTDGEVPAIDFAGAGRTVPWATWYESTAALAGNEQIFASRFDNTGDANQNKWIFGGQSRGTGTGSTPIPSLNIHTNQDAENPSVAGGSAADPTKPGPWVTWQESDAVPTHGTHKQIFVEKPIGPGSTNCTGVKPAAANPAAAPIGGFCWQQVGIDRVGGDPSLNVDPTRGNASLGEGGIEPDIAFTGANDAVPWVVWYENGATALAGLHTNEMVFAAKGVADGSADGGFHWQVVGQPGGGGVLDATGATNGFGPCAETAAAEAGCSINKDASKDAEDPRIAAGTMTAGNATVPWIVWDEVSGSTSQIFVARLVGGNHFELANSGQPISLDANPSTRPDITFSGNTPYVSWRENTGGSVEKAFYGHFVDAANPTFVLDASNVDITPHTDADVREPISSSCTANPFNADGATCQGGAVGTPFFLFTNGTAPRKLFAQAYQTDAPITGGSSSASASAALVSATVNPQGGPVNVQFEYGPTTAYGQTTGLQHLAPANAATSFAGLLSGLPASTVIHYRGVAFTDFGKVVGGDQSLTTAPVTTPPDKTPPHVKLKIAKTTIKKLLKAKVLKVRVTIDEAASVNLSGTAKAKLKKGSKNVTLGHGSTTFLKAGTKTVSIKLTAAARRVLRHARSATVKVTAKATDVAGNKSTKKATANLKHG